jgi:hypothetical protein
MTVKESFVETYFEKFDYEDIDSGQVGTYIRQIKRSTYNTAQEIKRYEALNAQQPVKEYHISELKR